jgi:cold shock CspA family protein
MRVQEGSVTKFFERKGYGFIRLSDGSAEVFVHYSDILDIPKRLVEGEPVDLVVVEGDKGAKATLVSRKVPRLLGVVRKFEKGFGFIERSDNSERTFVHHSAIVGQGFKVLEVGEEVEFSVARTDRGEAAVRVLRLDQRPPLERFALLGNFDQHLEQLAVELAHKENWSYRYAESTQRFPILYSYIYHTFARLEDEGKVATVNDASGAELACFNTGLVTEMQEEIFALFGPSRRTAEGQPEWLLRGFVRESDRSLTFFPRRPDIANYFADPAELIYDTRVELVVNMEHVIIDNKDRFPTDLRENMFALRSALDGSISAAKRRVRRNFKAGIPQF